MQLKGLLTDESAVSPVIGAILMVAITVILAAVIGMFVLSSGDQQEVPQASWDTSEHPEEANVTFEHRGGETLSGEQLTVNSDNGSIDDDGVSADDTFQAGDRIEVDIEEHSAETGESIRLVQSTEDGETFVVAEHTLEHDDW